MTTIISAARLLPREKLLQLGSESLTNAELLAILLGVGTKKESVFHIAEKIFPIYAASIIDVNKTPQYIAEQFNIPISHACKIVAFFALAKREMHIHEEATIQRSDDIASRYQHLSSYPKEYVVGIYTNARNTIIHEEILSIGTVNISLISAKELIEPAIRKHAVSVILCHNHPSGDPLPSKADIDLTKRLVVACNIFSIILLDHIIIGKKQWMSMHDLGHIP